MYKKLSSEVVGTRGMDAVGATLGVVGPTLDVEEVVTDIHGEVADMAVAVGSVMARDVQNVASLLIKHLMLYLKMISTID